MNSDFSLFDVLFPLISDNLYGVFGDSIIDSNTFSFVSLVIMAGFTAFFASLFYNTLNGGNSANQKGIGAWRGLLTLNFIIVLLLHLVIIIAFIAQENTLAIGEILNEPWLFPLLLHVIVWTLLFTFLFSSPISPFRRKSLNATNIGFGKLNS